jgi:hypothetical protein
MFYDKICVEIDTPYQNHGTPIKIMHDRVRDEFLAENDGIRTIRFNTFYIWPTNKATLEKAQANMPDDVILKELALYPARS